MAIRHKFPFLDIDVPMLVPISIPFGLLLLQFIR